MKHKILLFYLLIAYSQAFSQNVSNVQVQQIREKVHITYTLDKTADITLYLSIDGGVTYSGPLKQVSGNVGKNIPAGTRTIVWDMLTEKDKLVWDKIVFEIKAVSIQPIFETIKGITFEMVYVEGGSFIMGCTSEQGTDCFIEEEPPHLVNLSSYYIGKFEVTQELWEVVMDYNPSENKGKKLPVENVDWEDIQTFIRKLNLLTEHTYQLPSEAEWEFAARGGNKSNGYKYSGSNTLDQVGWFYDNSKSMTHSVGTKKPNELGIYDMSGNVWEWCNDWYGAYLPCRQTNPKGVSSGLHKVLRGGCFDDYAGNTRVSYRGDAGPVRGNRGFRLKLNYYNSEVQIYDTIKQNINNRYQYSQFESHDIDCDEWINKDNLDLKNTISTNKVISNVTIKDSVNGAIFEMVYVDGGVFTMGCTSEKPQYCWDKEKPAHQVTLSSYYIGKFEVTQELWQAVMFNNPSENNGKNLPIENVTWNEVQTFIKKLNYITGHTYRLPTEAEWEFAARGGNKSNRYLYSGNNVIDKVATYYYNSFSTEVVGSKSPNELGIYDMSGNVWELCKDWYGTYESYSQFNPKGPLNGSGRVARGGCFYHSPMFCFVFSRKNVYPDSKNDGIGFRLVRDN